MDTVLTCVFLGLAIQPCMMDFLVLFSAQKLVFCVSKFGAVGRGLTLAPRTKDAFQI